MKAYAETGLQIVPLLFKIRKLGGTFYFKKPSQYLSPTLFKLAQTSSYIFPKKCLDNLKLFSRNFIYFHPLIEVTSEKTSSGVLWMTLPKILADVTADR